MLAGSVRTFITRLRRQNGFLPNDSFDRLGGGGGLLLFPSPKAKRAFCARLRGLAEQEAPTVVLLARSEKPGDGCQSQHQQPKAVFDEGVEVEQQNADVAIRMVVSGTSVFCRGGPLFWLSREQTRRYAISCNYEHLTYYFW